MKNYPKLAAAALAEGFTHESMRVQGKTAEATKKAFTSVFGNVSRAKTYEALVTALTNDAGKFKAAAKA